MKKIFLVLLFGFLFSGNGYALSVDDIIKPGMTKKQVKKITSKGKLRNTSEMRKTSDPKTQAFCGFSLTTNANEYFPKFKTEITTHAYAGSIANGNVDEYPWYVFENVTKPITMPMAFCKLGDGILKGVYFSKEEALIAADPNYLVRKKKEKERKHKEEEKNTQKQAQLIEFNIKQKKEQCKAIGFEPKTEKFADCVLRLVELDVKSQQDNQIVSAESSGNEALVEELRKQRNLQSSRYLLDLGKQLRQPKQYNSNIYMPQTQRCTIMGFDTFATMNCR